MEYFNILKRGSCKGCPYSVKNVYGEESECKFYMDTYECHRAYDKLDLSWSGMNNIDEALEAKWR